MNLRWISTTGAAASLLLLAGCSGIKSLLFQQLASTKTACAPEVMTQAAAAPGDSARAGQAMCHVAG